MSVDAQSPSYEIGHLQVSLPGVGRGVRYIVEHRRDRVAFVLHADETASFHQDVVKAAKIGDEPVIIGGGKIRLEDGELELMDRSATYGKEPPDVRAALVILVRERLRDMINS